MNREELIEFLHRGLGICGCSENDDVVEFVRDLLEAGEMRDNGMHEEANATLDDMMPDGDCLERNLPIYWITAAGLTEHGYTMSEYGLSELGALVLAAIRDHGTGDELYQAPPEPMKGVLN